MHPMLIYANKRENDGPNLNMFLRQKKRIHEGEDFK